MDNTQKQSNPLIIIDFEKFGNMLYDKLYAIIGMSDILKKKYTILINMYNRGDKKKLQEREVRYLGVDRQKETLEQQNSEKIAEHLEEHWRFLKDNPVEGGGKIGTSLTEKFEKGKAGIDNLDQGDLVNYFKTIRNQSQLAEKHIFNEYFTIESDKYISLPLIRFGEYDGILHLIYQRDDDRKIRTRRSKVLLIREMTKAYEELLLTWDIVGDNKKQLSQINLKQLQTTEFYEKIQKNPILRDVNFQKYYQLYYPYFQQRIDQSNQVSGEFLNEYRKTAIISILIDSFAHNVSAHSLSALNWWFKERATEYKGIKGIFNLFQDIAQIPGLIKKDSAVAKITENLNDPRVRKYLGEYFNLYYKIYEKSKTLNPLAKFEGPLAPELHPFLKFLLEKGAFWSGITRNVNFGGKVSSLYKILWYDFISNPLYLGTIAHSEGITKINLNLTIFREEKAGFSPYENIKTVKTSKNQKILDGTFITIDLNKKSANIEEELIKIIQNITGQYSNKGTTNNNPAYLKQKIKEVTADLVEKEKEITFENIFTQLKEQLKGELKHPISNAIVEEMSHKSSFVSITQKFIDFREELLKHRVFFPGGVVGKHAFFTLIENELRNVKHYSNEQVEDMKKNGLNLNLSFHTRPIKGGKSEGIKDELLKVGVYLKHSQKINADLALKRLENIRGDIITEDYIPRLGGSLQDKICAAMLLNNDFNSVQKIGKKDSDNEMDKRNWQYYPWIKTAIEKATQTKHTVNIVEDFELSYRNIFSKNNTSDRINDFREQYKQFFDTDTPKAYLKKYFHVWKGDTVHTIQGELSLWENIPRFKFISISSYDEDRFRAIRQLGVIRVINEKITTLDERQKLIEAYKIWMSNWLKSTRNCVINFREGEDSIGKIVYSNKELTYYNKKALKGTIKEKVRKKGIPDININHGNKVTDNDQHTFHYRTHGTLIQDFFDGKTPKKGNILEHKLWALFEMLMTKICIIDNRVARRIPDKRLQFFKDHLNCHFCEESITDWQQVKSNLHDYHFVVLHLSFIESIKDKNEQKLYEEHNLSKFINQEIITNLPEDTSNFILVITTGRGRTRWWKSIEKEKYNHFTTFRPIESLVTGIENALQMKDDIDLKYNLVRILFGS